MNLQLQNDATLITVAEEISRQMAVASLRDGSVFIRTPICYPSGTSVVIQIDGSKDHYFVSDIGLGHQEALMVNASPSYCKIDRHLSQDTGVSFDNRSFFVAQSTRSDLPSVVSAVANLSLRAVIQTLIRLEEKKSDLEKTLLIHRLEDIFGRDRVSKDVSIFGASHLEWEVAARVSCDRIVSIFDHVKLHKTSVVSAVAKFHDIARLPDPPKRIVTVTDKASMADYLSLLSQAASVISLSEASDEVVRKLAA